MAANSKNQVNLDLKILLPQVKKAFTFLSKQNWLSSPAWYLAGGTALALQVKHRQSVDLDFFNKQKKFANQEILNNFLSVKNWKTNLNKNDTIYGELYNAKVSFIANPFFIPQHEFIKYGSINILQPLDLAGMKIIAISQRGKKRDFFDLYWCIKNIEPLENLIRRLKVQYPTVAHDYHHLLKSLVYFADAESDPEPKVNFETDWTEIKNFFTQEVPIIASKIIGLD